MQPVGKSEKLVMVAPTTGKTYTMTSGDSTATYVALAADTADIVMDGLIAAAAVIGREFTLIIFAKDVDPAILNTMYATAATKGHEFNFTTNAEITQSVETVAAGPNHWAAGNFDTDELPTLNDTVIFEDNNVNLLFNLGQGALTGINLDVRASYTGKIGWPPVNAQGNFPEYRDQWLKIGSDDVKIGLGEGAGSGRIKLDFNATAAAAVHIYESGSSGNVSLPAVQLQNGTLIDLTIDSGEVIANPFGTGPATTIDELRVSGSSNVILGTGVTCVNLNMSGSGSVLTESNVTTTTISGGTLTVTNAVALPTFTMTGGTLDHRSSGAVGVLTIDGGAIADFSNTTVSGTVITTVSIKRGRFVDPHGRTNRTNTTDYKTLVAS